MSLYERKTVAGRVTGTLAAFALVLSLTFGGAVQAQAQSSDLQAEIERLTALIAQLQEQIAGGSTSTGDFNYTFNTNLSIGSTGNDVLMLQRYLNRNSATQVAVAPAAGSPGNETSYYGPATAAAVSKYQVLHSAEILAPLGLTVGTGNFANNTRAFMNKEIASLGSDDGDKDDDKGSDKGDLKGGEGFITVEDLSVGAVDIDLGDEEVVYEFSVEAEDSDVEVNRVDVRFSKRPWLYFDEVRLLVDGDEVATLDGSGDFSETGNEWRARFTGLDVVIEEGDVVDFAIEVEVPASLAGSRDIDIVVVYLPEDGVRAVDGAGIIQYGPDADLDSVDVTFNDTFGQGSIEVSESSDSPDTDSIIITETGKDTNGEVVAIYEVEAEDGDVTLTGAHFQINAGIGNENDLVKRFRLYADGKLLDTSTVSNAGVLDFDGFDFVVEEDETVELTLEADFHPVATSNTIQVVLEDLFAEDEDFEDASWTTGITGDAVPVASMALVTTLEDKSTSTSEVGTATTGTAVFEIEVTAVGQDFWVPADASSFTIASSGTTTVLNKEVTVEGQTEDANGNYRLREGQTYTMEVEVIVEANANAGAQVTRVTLTSFTSDDESDGVHDDDNTHTLGAPTYQSSSMQVFTSN